MQIYKHNFCVFHLSNILAFYFSPSRWFLSSLILTMELSHMCLHALCFHNNLLLMKVWYEQNWFPMAVLFWYLSLFLPHFQRPVYPTICPPFLPLSLSFLPSCPCILLSFFLPYLLLSHLPLILQGPDSYFMGPTIIIVVLNFEIPASTLPFHYYNSYFFSSFRTIQGGFSWQHSCLAT